MPLEAKVDIEPRTTGQILDDAWRLYLADAPLLLALAGLFLVPASIALLMLLAQPLPAGSMGKWLLPALTALLLPLTGLGSGACQEVFRRRMEGGEPELRACLSAALRHGLDHIAARALLLLAGVAGLLLVFPALIVWIGMMPIHAILASGEGRLIPSVAAAQFLLQRQLGKASVIALARLLLALFAVINLHVLTHLGLWITGNLGGLDVALPQLLLSLTNPVYLIALVLLAWLLLVPFGEAAAFLLHMDTRARFEGFDLWHRVQLHFPTSARRGAAAGMVLLGLLLPAVAHAEDRLSVAREARQEVRHITREIETAEPYPGGERWAGKLDVLARRLNAPAARYAWFSRAIEGFAHRQRTGALEVLADLDRRLALVEESLSLPREQPAGEAGGNRLSRDEIKKLLPHSPEAGDPTDPAAQPPPEPEPDRQPGKRGEDLPRGRARGPGLVGPSSGGLTILAWVILGALVLVMLVLAVVFGLRGRQRVPSPRAPRTGELTLALESMLNDGDQSPDLLWRRADELARAGQFLEAVRVLYLAVLALLHQANRIRYERTRTNGEYVQQVRLSSAAPAALHEPFRRLVRCFEEKWYGERACAAEDYQECRVLAETIRAAATEDRG